MRQRHISMRLDVQRRLVLAAAAAGLSLSQQPALAQELSSKRVTWGPFKGMSDAELARLDELSKATNIGVMLAGSPGVRVIDLVWGDGPEPGAGQRVCSLQDLGRRLPKRPCRRLQLPRESAIQLGVGHADGPHTQRHRRWNHGYA